MKDEKPNDTQDKPAAKAEPEKKEAPRPSTRMVGGGGDNRNAPTPTTR